MFEPDGNLLDSAQPGPWTVDGQIRIKSIKLINGKLVIRGRRVLLVFDPETSKMRDLLTVGKKDALAASFGGDRRHEGWKDVAKHQQVTITIQLSSSTPSFAELSPSVTAVFLRSDEPLVDAVPSCWHDFLGGETSQTKVPPGFDETIFSAKESGVRPPHALTLTDPEYSETARRAHFSGTVELSVVVDKTGTVRDVQITKPAGLGLDEKSVDAVRTWKFDPAWKDAEPVATRIQVETSFRLY